MEQEVINYTDALLIDSKFENVMNESIRKIKCSSRTKSRFLELSAVMRYKF